jgi:hypothetical protein
MHCLPLPIYVASVHRHLPADASLTAKEWSHPTYIPAQVCKPPSIASFARAICPEARTCAVDPRTFSLQRKRRQHARQSEVADFHVCWLPAGEGCVFGRRKCDGFSQCVDDVWEPCHVRPANQGRETCRAHEHSAMRFCKCRESIIAPRS